MSAFISSQTGAPLRRRSMMVAGIAAAAVFVTTGAAHAAHAQPRSEAAASSVVLSSLDGIGTEDEVLTGIEEALSLFTEIPDEVLAQGEDATEQWLNERIAKTSGKRSFNAGGCARGILLAVGSNIFAVAKIYKMKKAIDKLGGIKKVVAKIRSKKKAGKTFKTGIMEVFEEAGSGLGGIAAEILGIDGVIKNCW